MRTRYSPGGSVVRKHSPLRNYATTTSARLTFTAAYDCHSLCVRVTMTRRGSRSFARFIPSFADGTQPPLQQGAGSRDRPSLRAALCPPRLP
jgi:hypothetical protein